MVSRRPSPWFKINFCVVSDPRCFSDSHAAFELLSILGFAGMFPTFESFAQIMDQCTENYECLVINNNAKTNKLQEQIYWYKADSHASFKLGSKEFWELSKGLGSDDEAEQYDPSNQKKRGPSISVKKSKW